MIFDTRHKARLYPEEWEEWREHCGFTREEKEVFDLMYDGASVEEMVYQLSRSRATINRRINSIKKKIIHYMSLT